MSRRSIPRIDPSDLCDHADEARIGRIWERLEVDLPVPEARASRRSAALWIAAAATLAAFGAGIFTGRSLVRHEPAPSVVAVTEGSSETDVLAAGEEARSFLLPGGGTITLSPGATVELERASGELTLKLVQGDATLETAQRNASMVVGDARLNTQAGSKVEVSRRVDNLSVDVRKGSASLDSPSMQEKLGSGDAVSVPLHREAASTPSSTAIAVARRRAPLHRASDATPVEGSLALGRPVPEAAVESAASDKEAAEHIQHAPGGFDAAIREAGRASELMHLRDLAHVARDGAAETQAFKRIAEAFPNDANAGIAVHWLCQRLGEGDGHVYCERDKQTPLFDPDAEQCKKLRSIVHDGHKDEALQAAREYLKSHADGGECRDEAQHVIAGGDDGAEPAPSGSSAPADPAASASASKPGASPPSSSASAKH